MNNFNFKNLCPFKWFVLQNFPFIEADFDAITNWQLFCKLGEEMNKIIEKVNQSGEQVENLTNAFIELQNYVNNYFENLDVQDEINNKLDEMAEDGTLEELIINNILDKKTPQTMNNLDLNRIIRTFERNANNPSHVSGEDYAVMQGGCYTGNQKMVIARLRNSTINEVLLQEISLYDSSVIRQTTLELNHANSITFNPETNKLYITSLLINVDSNNIPLQYLYVINYTTFELESVITLDLPSNEGAHSISYDILKDKYYLATEDFNNNNALKIYELNILNYNLTEIELEDYSNLLNKSYNNDILVYNGYLYILKYDPQVLICYNLETNKMFNIYNIPNYAEGSSTGELENISIKYDNNNNFIIGTNRTECNNGFYNIFQYYQANVFFNINNNTMPKWNNIEKVLHVDINSTSFNPNGTNSNRFKHLAEALEYAQILDGNVTILMHAGTYPFTDYRGNKQNIDIRRYENDSVTINGLCFMGSKVSLTYLTILNTSTSQNYDLYCDYCEMKLALLTFSGDFTTSIYARRCKINFFNLTSSKILFYCQTETELFPIGNEGANATPIEFEYTNQKPYYDKFNCITPELTVTKTKVETSAMPKKNFLLQQQGTCRVFYYGHYNRGYCEFVHDGNESQRNFSFSINRYIYEVACFFDYTNNKVGLQILGAYLLNTDGTVSNITDSESLTMRLFLK